MAVIENRAGGVSIAGGVLVAVAATAVLIVLGAALAASSGGAMLEVVYERPEAVYVWLIGALAVGSFLGGRSAAASSRVLTRRDGAYAGLFVWAAITVVLLAVGAAWIAAAPVLAWQLAPLLDWGLWT